MNTYYADLVFRNGATRTYEVLESVSAETTLGENDVRVAWEVDLSDPDFFSYNYLRDPETDALSHDPIEDPELPEAPQPDAVGMMLCVTPGCPSMLLIAFCACVPLYSHPYYTAGRIAAWAVIKQKNDLPAWLRPHWVANIETWARWNAVPITP